MSLRYLSRNIVLGFPSLGAQNGFTREGTKICIQVQVPIQVLQTWGCGGFEIGVGGCTIIGRERGSRGCNTIRTMSGIGTGGAIGGGGNGGGGGEGHGLMSSSTNCGSWTQK